MSGSEKLGFVKQAERLLTQRMTRIESLSSQIMGYRKGSKSKTMGYVVLQFLVLAAASLAAFVAGHYVSEPLTLLIFWTCAMVCFYCMEFFIKNVLILYRIFQVNHHLRALKAFQDKVKACIEDIGNIAIRADEKVFGSSNKVLAPQYHFDSTINKYDTIIKKYQKTPKNFDSILAVIHFVFIFIFGCALLLYLIPVTEAFFIGFAKQNTAIILSLAAGLLFIYYYTRLQIRFMQKRIRPLRLKTKRIISVSMMVVMISFQGYLSGWFGENNPIARISARPYEEVMAGPENEAIEESVSDNQNIADYMNDFSNSFDMLWKELEQPLRRRMRSNEVADLQKRLNLIGEYYEMEKLETDGSFGPATENAVKSFQKLAGLNADGVVDSETWFMIISFENSLLHADFITTTEITLYEEPDINAGIVNEIPERALLRVLDVHSDEWVFVSYVWWHGYINYSNFELNE